MTPGRPDIYISSGIFSQRWSFTSHGSSLHFKREPGTTKNYVNWQLYCTSHRPFLDPRRKRTTYSSIQINMIELLMPQQMDSPLQSEYQFNYRTRDVPLKSQTTSYLTMHSTHFERYRAITGLRRLSVYKLKGGCLIDEVTVIIIPVHLNYSTLSPSSQNYQAVYWEFTPPTVPTYTKQLTDT